MNGSSRLPKKRSWIFVLVMGLYSALTALFLIGVITLFISGNRLAAHDFVSYWSAGKLLVAGSNPYDPATVGALEVQSGFDRGAYPLIMRNPPTGLLIAIPFAGLSLRVASLIWSILLAGSLVLAIRLIQSRYESDDKILFIFGVSFGPAILCVLSGQTAILVLLGYCLFLSLYRTLPFWSGCSLWLCALKPHLLLPTAVVMTLWAIYRRNFKFLIGIVSTITVSIAVALKYDASIFSHYWAMLTNPLLDREFVPSAAIMLRRILPNSVWWVQYIPAMIGCIWAAWFFQRKREVWKWEEHGNTVLLVSLAVAPYAWISDLTIAIPALLFATLRFDRQVVLFMALLTSSVELMTIFHPNLHAPIYAFFAPACLVFYLWTMSRTADAQRRLTPNYEINV